MSLWSSLDTAFAAMLLGSLVWGWWRGLVYEVLAIVNWLTAAAQTDVAGRPRICEDYGRLPAPGKHRSHNKCR